MAALAGRANSSSLGLAGVPGAEVRHIRSRAASSLCPSTICVFFFWRRMIVSRSRIVKYQMVNIECFANRRMDVCLFLSLYAIAYTGNKGMYATALYCFI